MKIIGISGLARSGKDSFFEISKEILEERNINKGTRRLAFADELKSECDEFLSGNTGISAFTEKNSEKEIIRPFLVTYGTHIRRRLNKRCWIDKVEKKLSKDNKDLIFITDVRYENEIEWVHSLSGSTVHVEREGNIAPNEEEIKNDPILKNKSLHNIHWKTFSKESMPLNKVMVGTILNKIINNEKSN
tara:strand:+ start:3958 stop:4524 length:567 start_codon:yes stop_codon:yes gene_type:complete